MKRFLFSVPVFLFLSSGISAQYQYEVYPDKEHLGGKIYKGIISREVLLKDTSFRWYAENQKYYSPMIAAVEAFKKNRDSLEVLAFMGTWCEDSHFIIPRLYELLDSAGFSNEKVTLIGTDRNKKTLSHLCEALNIYNVPTLIIMKNGKELGRVVEYGKYGIFDKELAEIISSK